ncbi:MAG: hypothetical protein MR014_04220 [Oscillospiraceae bacterium]|nr:hypothetical protein [Oscillospiraceae bacterium]
MTSEERKVLMELDRKIELLLAHFNIDVRQFADPHLVLWKDYGSMIVFRGTRYDCTEWVKHMSHQSRFEIVSEKEYNTE